MARKRGFLASLYHMLVTPKKTTRAVTHKGFKHAGPSKAKYRKIKIGKFKL